MTGMQQIGNYNANRQNPPRDNKMQKTFRNGDRAETAVPIVFPHAIVELGISGRVSVPYLRDFLQHPESCQPQGPQQGMHRQRPSESLPAGQRPAALHDNRQKIVTPRSITERKSAACCEQISSMCLEIPT
jgi:hypothetical protein